MQAAHQRPAALGWAPAFGGLSAAALALIAGGYVAAWLAGIELRFDGMLHGLVTWGIATLLTFWLLTSTIGGIIGGGFSALSSIASAAGSGVSEAAKPIAQAAGVSPDMIQQQAQAYLKPTNTDPAAMSPQDAQKAIATDLVTYTGGGADAAAAKERIVNVMAAQMKISHDEAAKKFDDAQAKLKQTRDKAVQIRKRRRGCQRLGSIENILRCFRGGAARCIRRCLWRFACRATQAGAFPSHREYRPRLITVPAPAGRLNQHKRNSTWNPKFANCSSKSSRTLIALKSRPCAACRKP